MPEPKIALRLERGRPDDDGNFKVYFTFGAGAIADPWLPGEVVDALESALTENAGLREALEASEAECAKVIEERDAMRPVVQAAREITSSGDMPTTLMWVRLATAVDAYIQSSNPGETS